MTYKIRTHLAEYANSKGWGTDDNTLFEIVRESKEVYSHKTGSHRWYDDLFVVVEVNGMYIGYSDYYMTGDSNASDMGLDYDINSICEVREVEKTIKVFEKVTL